MKKPFRRETSQDDLDGEETRRGAGTGRRKREGRPKRVKVATQSVKKTGGGYNSRDSTMKGKRRQDFDDEPDDDGETAKNTWMFNDSCLSSLSWDFSLAVTVSLFKTLFLRYDHDDEDEEECSV